jgi:hypothetical protein
MVRALGVVSPRVPPAVGETVEELRMLGSLTWLADGLVDAKERIEALHQLAAQIHGDANTPRNYPPVLAALLAMQNRGSRRDMSQVISLGRGLARAMPDNALVLAELARSADMTQRANIAELPLKELRQNLQIFPNNYLLRTTESIFQKTETLHAGARRAAEMAVRCSSRDPDAWLFLSEAIFAQADAVRRGRTINAMTEEELKYCAQFYEERMPVILKSVELDPRYENAWMRASSAAAFQGDGKLADSAFWKAAALAPRSYHILSWGVQLYQPKWFDDPEKLVKVIEMAASAAEGWNANARVNIAFQAYLGGVPQSAWRIPRTDDERATLQAMIERHGQEHGTRK